MTHCVLGLLANTEPAPAWILDRLARPDRAPLAPVDGFEYDRPRSIAAAYGHVGHLVDTSDVPVDGNRDDHLYRFLARMHGIGIGKERAHALYDEFLQISGGTAPDGWPNDEKSWAKIRRIWDGGGADNPPGSELAPLTIAEAITRIAPPADDRLPEDRLWDIADLISRPAIRYWDAEHLFPRVNGGYVGVWFGKYGHHKTNFMLSKLRALLEATNARVLYLMGEGIGGMGQRLAAHLSYANRSAVEFEGRLKLFRVPHMADQVQIAATMQLCAAEGFAPDIVIVDTLATALSGLDEDNRTASLLNSNGPVGGIARALGCLLILIGHEGEKAGKLRGGSGFYGNVDYVVYVKADADKRAVALTASTEGPEGKIRDGEPVKVYYAIEYHHGVPIPVPTSAAGYAMLTGKEDWNSGSLAGALTKLGAPVSADVLIMELYPREGMDPEDWQARCATLARKLDRAARDGNPALSHLYEITDDDGVRWRVS